MSAIKEALIRLDEAIDRLGDSAIILAEERGIADSAADGNVIDVDFVAGRIDRAIATVEMLLAEEG